MKVDKFIPQLSEKRAPLRLLTKKGRHWNDERDKVDDSKKNKF